MVNMTLRMIFVRKDNIEYHDDGTDGADHCGVDNYTCNRNIETFDFLVTMMPNHTQEELLTEEGSIQITMASHYDLQVPLKVSIQKLQFTTTAVYWCSLWHPTFCFFTQPQCHKLLWITTVAIERN